MVPLSVLDLAPIVEGGDASDAFRRSLDLAQHAERLGYRRFWLAEHHGLPGIASAATAVVIGHVAAGTSTIRGKTFEPLAAIAAVSADDIWMVSEDDFLHYTCR